MHKEYTENNIVNGFEILNHCTNVLKFSKDLKRYFYQLVKAEELVNEFEKIVITDNFISVYFYITIADNPSEPIRMRHTIYKEDHKVVLNKLVLNQDEIDSLKEKANKIVK